MSSDHRFLSLLPFALVSLLFLGTLRIIVENPHSKKSGACNKPRFPANFPATRSMNISSETFVDFGGSLRNGCDVFQGRWVLDMRSRPLYEEECCPYLTQPVTCQKNGRPDLLYQSWRWEPHGCQLPRFDGVKLLEKLRDKRMMFVGDSLQRTQWESMVCLVNSAIPDTKKSMRKDPPRRIFRVEEFNATIEFYWAPFLVESNADHAVKHRVQKRFVKLDSIHKHSQQWEGVQVLVFDSYVWWMSKPTINVSIGSHHNVEESNVPKAYRLALNSWSKWVDSHINPLTQKVFFMSMSPTHLWSWEWKDGTNGNCFNEAIPIERKLYWGTGSNLDIMRTIRDVLQAMKVHVTFLNITQLSEYRKDGHTSVYTERRGKLLTDEQRSDPNTYADCIHWCLPGVPDTWNEILYAYLLYDTENSYRIFKENSR